MNDQTITPAKFAMLIEGIEERRLKAISAQKQGEHEDIIGFWDGYRHACEDFLAWANDCNK